jgi:hypothetical protein
VEDRIAPKDPVSDSPNEVYVVHEYPAFIEWIKTVATNITDNRFTIGLAVAAASIALFFFYPSVGGDQDTWFHLRYGAHFVKNLTWKIDHGQFNWTPFQSDFKYVTWIGSSVLYIFYSLFSHYGLYLLQYLIFFAIIFCLIRYLRKTGYRFDITSMLSIMAVFLVMGLKFIYIKPDMFSGLLFAVSCFVYFTVKKTDKGKLFYLYPPLFLLWVNTHGGFIVGLFLVSAALGAELLNAMFFKKASLGSKNLKHLAIAVLVSYVVLGINPEGYSYFIDIIRGFFSSEMKVTKETILEYQSIWSVIALKPAGPRFRFAAFPMLGMFLAFILICAYLVWKKKFFDFSVTFLVIFFYVFGMSIVRASQYFPFLWFFSFFYLYAKFEDVKFKGLINFVSLCLIIFLSVKIVHFAMVDIDSLSWFGVNWEESYPVKEVEYIKKAKPPGNIWNDYLSGGYLLWALYPDYKVFMDPRYGSNMTKFMPSPEEFSSPEGVESYSNRFPFKVALVAYHEGRIIEWLLKADWRLAFLDRNGLVIVHKSMIPQLSKDALAEDVSVKRFINVTNPSILRTLFNFYVNLGEAGPVFGREVFRLYQQNVRSWYGNREKDINEMRMALAQREAEVAKLKNKAAEQGGMKKKL